MLNEAKYMQNFYHQQNIQIRKQIREMDMQIREQYSKNSNNETLKEQQSMRQDVNFLVIGPAKSGKSSLLKSMYFALNSNLNVETSVSQLPATFIKKWEIKRSKKYHIQGLAKLKQTDQKRTISAFQFESKIPLSSVKQLTAQQKSAIIFQKYANALQIIDNKIFGCFKVSTIPSNNQLWKSQNQTKVSPVNTIKTVLIVLSIIAKIQYDEISCMKFFLSDLRQKGVKALIILTHVDKLNKMKENAKLTLIEERINILRKQLDIKDRDDFICIQSYNDFANSNLHKGDHNVNKNVAVNNFNDQYNNSGIKNGSQHKKIFSQTQKNRYYEGDGFKYKKVSQVNADKQQCSNLSYSKVEYENSNFQIPIINKYHKFGTSFETSVDKLKHNVKNNVESHSNVTENQNININTNSSFYKNSNSNIQNAIQTNTQTNIQPNYSNQSTRLLNQKPAPIKIKQIQTAKNYQSTQQHSTSSQKLISPNHQFRQNQPSYPLSKPVQFSQQFIMVNNQQINYYSLKLLIKIIKENQKYVAKEISAKKMLKWFCG